MSEDGEGPLVLWEKGGDNKTHQTNAVKELDDILRFVGVVITRHGATQDGDEGPMVTQIMGKDSFKEWVELPADDRDAKAGFECIGSTDIFGAALFETSEQFQVSFEKINDVGKVTPRGGKYMGDAKGHDVITTEHAFKHQSGELYQLEAPLNVPGSKPLQTENRVFLAPLKGLIVMVAFASDGSTQMTRDHKKRIPRVDAVRVDGIFPTTFGSVAHEVSTLGSLFLVPCSSFLVPRSSFHRSFAGAASSEHHACHADRRCTRGIGKGPWHLSVSNHRSHRPCDSWTMSICTTAGAFTSATTRLVLERHRSCFPTLRDTVTT